MRYWLLCAAAMAAAPGIVCAQQTSGGSDPIVWSPGPPHSHRAGGFTGDVDVLIGWRSLNSAYWAPTDHVQVYGVDVDMGAKSFPVRGELSIQGGIKNAD